VLTEKLEIKRLDFLDVVRDQVGEGDKDDAEALFNAEFALMTGELAHLLPAVVAALGGELASAPVETGAVTAELPRLQSDKALAQPVMADDPPF
jgi:recombination associated protein RdgC